LQLGTFFAVRWGRFLPQRLARIVADRTWLQFFLIWDEARDSWYDELRFYSTVRNMYVYVLRAFMVVIGTSIVSGWKVPLLWVLCCLHLIEIHSTFNDLPHELCLIFV
jgi:hypothetical protein